MNAEAPSLGSAENKAGEQYVNEQKYQLAVEKFREAIAKDPNNLEFIYNLGTALYELGDYKNAIIEVKKYVKAYPTSHVALSYIGASYDCIHDNKRSLKYYHLASEYDSVSTIFLSALSSLYLANKQWDKALFYINKSIEYAVEEDKIEEYYSTLGEIYARMGQPQLGLEIAMKGYTSKTIPNFGIGLANYRLKRYAAAMIQFNAYVNEGTGYLCTSPYYLARCIWKSSDKKKELNRVIEIFTNSVNNVVKLKYGKFWPKSHYRRGEIYLFYCNQPALALADFKYIFQNYEKAPIYSRFSKKKEKQIQSLIRIIEFPLLPEIKVRNNLQVNSLDDWQKLFKESDVDKGDELKEKLNTIINNNLNIYDIDNNSNTLLHWIANHINDLSNDSSNPKALAKISLTFDIISLVNQRKIAMANNQGDLPLDLLFNSEDLSQRTRIRSILVNKYKNEAIRRMIFKPNTPVNSNLLDLIVKLLQQGAGADLLSKGKNITNFLIGEVFIDQLKTANSLESDYLLVYLAHLISIGDNNENLIDFVDKEKLFNTNAEIFFALRLRMFVQIIVHLFNGLSLPSSLRNEKSQIINILVGECSKLMEMIEIHRLQTSIRRNGNKDEIWLRCLAIRVTQKIKQLKTNERYLLHSSFNSHINIFIEFQKVSKSHYNIVIYNLGEGSGQFHETTGQKILPFVCCVPVSNFEENISPIVFNFLKSNSGLVNLQEYLYLIYCSFPAVCIKINQMVISFSQFLSLI